jgi:putative hydrolase of the HAD superfamily
MTAIDTVIFDVGRVLVHLDFRRILAFFDAHGIDVVHISELLERIDLAAYERGAFDGAALLARIQGLATRPMDREELRRHWLDIFVPQPPMLELARRLSGSHRVFILSNVGDLHWEHLDAAWGIASIGQGAIASYKVGASKPDPAIYRRAEDLFRLEPRRTVFIDDMVANVDAARERRWHAIHHRDHDSTAEDLRLLGVPA